MVKKYPADKRILLVPAHIAKLLCARHKTPDICARYIQQNRMRHEFSVFASKACNDMRPQHAQKPVHLLTVLQHKTHTKGYHAYRGSLGYLGLAFINTKRAWRGRR